MTHGTTLRWLRTLSLLILMTSPAAKADLDVAFVLDTTGSMSGEIREVRDRVRQLAGAAVEVREGQRVRFGVVAFRDRGDDYVTRVSPLSEDISVSQTFLDSLVAAGGGDGPEAVVAAMQTALTDLLWDVRSSTERQVFLIGDAPPHLDYVDEPDLEDLSDRARSLRIAVHTIGCRSLPASGVHWFRSLAYSTDGTYQHIGRVRGPGVPSLEDAVLEKVAGVGEISEQPISAVWQGRREAEVRGILVRQGGLREPGQGSGELDPCTLEIRLPRGLVLGTDPLVIERGKRLRVELDLRADPTTSAGIDWWSLERCPPRTRPIDVRWVGGER